MSDAQTGQRLQGPVPLPPSDPPGMPMPPGMPDPDAPPPPIQPPPDTDAPIPGDAPPTPVGDPPSDTPMQAAPAPPAVPEIGGPKGLEPTRYGDWERKGRAYDF